MMNALALIIGNNEYSLEKDRLINAVNDSNDFSSKLHSLGFITKTINNCDQETFARSIQEFGEELNKFDVGLFYFSGHGLQIDGKNYLTAVNTNFADDVSAKYTSIPLDLIIEYMQKANPIVKILILDACRDNPLPSQYRSLNTNGLAPIYAPKGSLIAFSTSPGEKALDYGMGRNSIYTGSLLNHIDDTNIPIEDFFKRVRTSVYTLSNGKQTSWEHTSLIGDFYFNSGQLIHSIELPYNHDFIADENFMTNGSDIQNIIHDLKSYDYYIQKPALNRLNRLNPEQLTDSELFIIGRNILQVAIGGEFTAQSIVRNLSQWLQKYQVGERNHVLNGLLFEIYFNSKGQFRQGNLKNEFISEIFSLQNDSRYKASFDFICLQLTPFKDHIFYFPTAPSTAFPIEIQFEKTKRTSWDNQEFDVFKLQSVKHAEKNLILEDEIRLPHYINISFEQFLDMLHKELSVPKNMLRLSINHQEKEITEIVLPWGLKLKK